MFEFLKDGGNYDQRCVENYKDGSGLVVDTARVSDGKLPFETAVQHPRYNRGQWVIVEAYTTRDQSRIGHRKWVAMMTGPLPDKLTDCLNSHASQLLDAVGGQIDFPLDS